MTRYDAFCALLALPDPIDLPRRSRRWLCAGEHAKQSALELTLARAWLTRRQEDAMDSSEIVSVRRTRLRLARTA